MRGAQGAATAILNQRGFSVSDVARRLSPPIDNSYLSKQLKGRRPLRPDVLPAISVLAGADVAAQVARAIAEAAAANNVVAR